MPHQCTNCGRRFPDGSKEMLSGCPDCGGNKFQFRPTGREAGESSSSPPAARDAGSASPADSDPGSRPSSASADSDPLSRSWPTHDDPGDDDADIIEPDPPDPPSPEDHAQADARAEVAASDELADPAHDDPGPPAPASTRPEAPSDDATVAATPDEDRPDLAELREELNDQFESIRVLNPGQYELNLMELYDREEYIISLREDGRYVIEVPETWRRSDPE